MLNLLSGLSSDRRGISESGPMRNTFSENSLMKGTRLKRIIIRNKCSLVLLRKRVRCELITNLQNTPKPYTSDESGQCAQFQCVLFRRYSY